MEICQYLKVKQCTAADLFVEFHKEKGYGEPSSLLMNGLVLERSHLSGNCGVLFPHGKKPEDTINAQCAGKSMDDYLKDFREREDKFERRLGRSSHGGPPNMTW